MPRSRQRRNHGALIVALAAMLGLFSCAKRKPSDLAQVTAEIKADPKVSAVLQQPGHEIEYSQTVESPNLETIKFRQTVSGVEVIGSGVAMHTSDNAKAIDNHLEVISISTTPKYSAKEAAKLARKLEPGAKPAEKPYLRILPGKGKRPPRLVYVVELDSHKQVWLDALSREHIATLSDQLDALEELVKVRSASGQGLEIEQKFENHALASCELAPLKSTDSATFEAAECRARVEKACQAVNWAGIPLFTSPENCEPGADESAARATDNAHRLLRYFQETHGRNSYDGRGSPLVSVVHAGLRFANATWNKGGSYLVYGDGDGTEFQDFTHGLDIAAHEFTHGVIENSAKLLSFGEAGALNESLADFFGKMVEDQGDWNFGARVYLNNGDGKKALRDLRNPERLQGNYKDAGGGIQSAPYPKDRAHSAPIVEPCVRSNDYCGVHFNATIPGHAWYQLHEKLGRKRTEALLYTTLTHYLNELSGFSDAAQATLQACATQLSAGECAQVKAVFQSSGLLGEAN